MPISNALVRLYGLTYSSFASVQTGAGGVFQFSGVRPGTYHLHVSSTGFIDESFNNIRCESQNPVQDCVGAHGITFSFGSPEQTDVIFELDQAAQLAGRATIRAGYSWSNDLRLHRLASDATILSTHSTYMNSDGSYTLREVAAGSFFWGASKPYFFSQIFWIICTIYPNFIFNVNNGYKFCFFWFFAKNDRRKRNCFIFIIELNVKIAYIEFCYIVMQ